MIKIKHINLSFVKEDWDRLKKQKGKRTWEEFILYLCDKK